MRTKLIYGVGVPKCGTHLLGNFMDAIPAETLGLLSGAGMANLKRYDIERFSLPDLTTAWGHLPPDEARPIDRNTHSYIVIFRFPPAMIVSYYHWLEKSYLRLNQASPFKFAVVRRLSYSSGVLAMAYGGMRRIAEYLDWLRHPRAICIRYEALVGEAGGGTTRGQQETIKAICDHCGIEGFACPPGALARETATYRRGQIDGWKDGLSDATIAGILDETRALNKRLGYADDGTFEGVVI